MGGFFLTNARDSVDEGLGVFARKGLPHAATITFGDFQLHVYQKLLRPAENLYQHPAGDFVLAVGTLIYKDAVGRRARELLYADWDADGPSCGLADGALRGHFAVVLKKRGAVHVLNDAAGMYRLFLSTAEGVSISNSYLAVVHSLRNRSVSAQEAYEFVCSGAFYGGRTPCKQVRMVSPCEILVLSGNNLEAVERRPAAMPAVCPAGSLESYGRPLLETVRGYFRVLREHFDGDVIADLTGGYDSRLVAASLKHEGIRYAAAVSTESGSTDVAVARHIARQERLPLLVHDVDAGPETLDRQCDLLRRAYYLCDAFATEVVPYGPGVLGYGEARAEKASLVLGGGGGENFRAYREWAPPRPVSVGDLARRTCPLCSICVPRATVRDYYARLDAKMQAALGVDRRRLLPGEVSRLYQLFRMRYWGGRGLSFYNQCFHYLAPFTDAGIAFATFGVPLELKRGAALEQWMIRQQDEQMAAYPSGYGNGFAENKGFSLRRIASGLKSKVISFVKDWSPQVLIGLSRSILHRTTGWHPARAAGPWLWPQLLQQVVGPPPYAVSEFIPFEKCTHMGPLLLSRCYTLEMHLRMSGLV